MRSSVLSFRRIAAIALVLSTAIIFLPGFVKGVRLRYRNTNLREQIKMLTEENKGLEAEVEKLKSDPDYVEKVARDQMGMVKEGEVVYSIVEPH